MFTAPLPTPPGVTDSDCPLKKPPIREGTLVGMSPDITFTTPPIAALPYSSDAGPRITSMRSALFGSATTA